MAWGPLLTIWTVRLALVAYVLAVLVGRRRPPNVQSIDRRYRISRVCWTVGSLLLLGHVLAAFHFFHAWSHQRAWESTAQQTDELLGWPYGDGIYFNHVFTALWLLDVAWWWAGPSSYLRRPQWLNHAIHLYLAFIMFNATVVFKDGALRWTALAVTLVIAAVVGRRLLVDRASRPPPGNRTCHVA